MASEPQRYTFEVFCRHHCDEFVRSAKADDEGEWVRHKDHATAIDRAIAEERESKDVAYNERNRLVALLAAIFPSWRTRHPDSETDWEDDWRTIIGVQMPAGQCTWHIHDSEVHLFAHVTERDIAWDGHTTKLKYERISNMVQFLLYTENEILGGDAIDDERDRVEAFLNAADERRGPSMEQVSAAAKEIRRLREQIEETRVFAIDEVAGNGPGVKLGRAVLFALAPTEPGGSDDGGVR